MENSKGNYKENKRKENVLVVSCHLMKLDERI